jgi:hypothetical protein
MRPVSPFYRYISADAPDYFHHRGPLAVLANKSASPDLRPSVLIYEADYLPPIPARKSGTNREPIRLTVPDVWYVATGKWGNTLETVKLKTNETLSGAYRHLVGELTSPE